MTGKEEMVVMAIQNVPGQTMLGEERERLAQTLRAILSEAKRPRIHITRAPIAREHVASAARELELLADRLQAPGRVDPRGIIDVSSLVSDGSGPLYNRHSVDELGAAATAARLALGPAEQSVSD
jgi:hypothetical protein